MAHLLLFPLSRYYPYYTAAPGCDLHAVGTASVIAMAPNSIAKRKGSAIRFGPSMVFHNEMRYFKMRITGPGASLAKVPKLRKR
jgi:hypothetical protein